MEQEFIQPAGFADKQGSFDRSTLVAATEGRLAQDRLHVREATMGSNLGRLEYEAVWHAAPSSVEFGKRISTRWCDQYVEATGAPPDDIVTVDPGNGFNYDFDLAGSLKGVDCGRDPRVIGVWGLSRPPSGPRDAQRMRGHPRRGQDDRGHLIAHAAGGEYDINLVPMNASLNRGWSTEGQRFRRLERQAATPGSLFFVHLQYSDTSDRPSAFRVGVQDGDGLRLGEFLNTMPPAPPMWATALRQATAMAVSAETVEGSLGHDWRDQLFERAWRNGVGTLSLRERNAIAGVTGHIAESIVAVQLVEDGWNLLWQFSTTGRHGVDMVVLSPDGRVVAVEVKGTLVSGRIPRLSRRELAQMSPAWIDKVNNPGMQELGLHSADVYGAVVVVNLADCEWRSAFTNDFLTLQPVEDRHQLVDLTWLDSGPSEVPI